MKRIILFFCILGLGQLAFAQKKINNKSSSVKKKEVIEESWKNKLWYGGGFSFGINSGTQTSTFNIGLSPMIGYKILPEVSIGPRFDFNYTFYKINLGVNNVKKVNASDIGVGVFARYKFLPFLFAHYEYMQYFYQIPQINTATGDIIKVKINQPKSAVGLGYLSSAGSKLGFEATLLYILSNNDYYKNTTALPLEFRFGINYNL